MVDCAAATVHCCASPREDRLGGGWWLLMAMAVVVVYSVVWGDLFGPSPSIPAARLVGLYPTTRVREEMKRDE